MDAHDAAHEASGLPHPLATRASRYRFPRMHWGFRARGKIGASLLLVPLLLTMFSQPIIEKDSWVELLVKALAWVAFSIGILFRFWSTLYVGGRKRVELIREGPYSICRNPLYFGSLFNALATGLFLQSVSFAVFLLLLVVVYVSLTVPAEEHDLRAIHGAAYDDYCRTVPRFWPRISLFRTPPTIGVSVKGLRRELKRAMLWLLLPVMGGLVCYLRYQTEWPHLFRLL